MAPYPSVFCSKATFTLEIVGSGISHLLKSSYVHVLYQRSILFSLIEKFHTEENKAERASYLRMDIIKADFQEKNLNQRGTKKAKKGGESGLSHMSQNK